MSGIPTTKIMQGHAGIRREAIANYIRNIYSGYTGEAFCPIERQWF